MGGDRRGGVLKVTVACLFCAVLTINKSQTGLFRPGNTVLMQVLLTNIGSSYIISTKYSEI